MKHVVCSVYDAQAKAFARPYFAVSNVAGQRMFFEACADTNTDLNKYPEDYVLYQVAEFDDSDGVFQNIVPPERICGAVEAPHLEKGK